MSAKVEVPTEHLPKVHRIRAIDKRVDTRIGDGKHEEGVFQVFLHVIHLLLVEVKKQNNGCIRRPTSDVSLKHTVVNEVLFIFVKAFSPGPQRDQDSQRSGVCTSQKRNVNKFNFQLAIGSFSIKKHILYFLLSFEI